MNNIRLIATIVAKENHENEVLSACKAMIKPSHQDDGCIQYELHKDTTQPRTFIFLKSGKTRMPLMNIIKRHI